MPTYQITYTQTAFWTVEVTSKDEWKALEKAGRIYQNDTEKMKWGGITESFYQIEGEL